MQKSLVMAIVVFLITINFFSAVGKDQTQIDSYNRKQFLESYENYGFGYRLYNPDSSYDPGPVFFKLDEPGTIYTLAYDNHTITGGCYDSYTYNWYVCDDSGNIWTIKIWSGDMELIFSYGGGFSALTFDPQTGAMIGAYETCLYGIDIQSGEILWVWDIFQHNLGFILGMAANGFGHLYFVDTFNNLWRLDLDTFTPTCVGPLLINIDGNADLEFDFNTGILYLSTYTTQGELYKVDTWDGQATLIGNYEEGARISGFIIPWNWPPYPPGRPQITGQTHGKINVEYEYKFVSVDPEGDYLTYIINWSDGNVEEHGLYPAGEPIIVKHAWSEKGTYIIKAKARKLNGLESTWGTLQVTMPRSKVLYNSLFLKLFDQVFCRIYFFFQRVKLGIHRRTFFIYTV